jgi:hypothetical protein
MNWYYWECFKKKICTYVVAAIEYYPNSILFPPFQTSFVFPLKLEDSHSKQVIVSVCAVAKYLFEARKMFSSSTTRKAFDAITVNKQHFLRIIHFFVIIVFIFVCMTSWFSSQYVVLLTYTRPTHIYFIYNLKFI